ncbi:MAG: hypothetical protein HN982_13165 [Candidatus Marinimicrobia bacterium]|jgi:hypothetical protein|nr:hypothetical protein [Candidatus Neomarinimicrobiota bacterium]
MISKDKALDIVGDYLGNQSIYELTIITPDLTHIYNSNKLPKNVWYVHVFNTNELKIGGGRMIGINKETNEICYDGGDGGE